MVFNTGQHEADSINHIAERHMHASCLQRGLWLSQQEQWAYDPVSGLWHGRCNSGRPYCRQHLRRPAASPKSWPQVRCSLTCPSQAAAGAVVHRLPGRLYAVPGMHMSTWALQCGSHMGQWFLALAHCGLEGTIHSSEAEAADNVVCCSADGGHNAHVCLVGGLCMSDQ